MFIMCAVIVAEIYFFQTFKPEAVDARLELTTLSKQRQQPITLQSRPWEVLYMMGFDLSSMERRGFCHNNRIWELLS